MEASHHGDTGRRLKDAARLYATAEMEALGGSWDSGGALEGLQPNSTNACRERKGMYGSVHLLRD